MAPPVAGLFGKLPAHGDFVRRGWPDDTVDAIDRWLTETIAGLRDGRDDEDFATFMRAAPLWRGYVPPGQLGADALHLGIAPSIDRAGRLFPIAAGVSGEAAAVWRHACASGAAVDDAIYGALADGTDADAAVAAVARSIDAADDTLDDAPATSAWWLVPDGEPQVESATVDPALLARLLCEGQV